MTDMSGNSSARVLRHHAADRVYHWLMAISMLVLLITGFLPVLGIKFAWVAPHWIAGVVLTVLVLFHIVRALFVLDPWTIWIRWREFRDSVHATTKEALGGERRKNASANIQ